MSLMEIVKENLLYWFVCQLLFVFVGSQFIGGIFSEPMMNGYSIIVLIFIGRGVYQKLKK